MDKQSHEKIKKSKQGYFIFNGIAYYNYNDALKAVEREETPPSLFSHAIISRTNPPAAPIVVKGDSCFRCGQKSTLIKNGRLYCHSCQSKVDVEIDNIIITRKLNKRNIYVGRGEYCTVFYINYQGHEEIVEKDDSGSWGIK